METNPHTRYTAEQLHEDEAASGPLKTADEQLYMIEDRVAAGDTTPEQRREHVDMALQQLVRDTVESYVRGELSIDKAGSMLLIAIEKIDEYKGDDDPTTNGEKIAAALALAPPELLEGPLRQFAEAEGNDELARILSEISRDDPRNQFGLAA